MSEGRTVALESQLIDLQTQVAFQEQTIAALNEALLGQQQQLDRFRVEISLLRQRLEDMQDSREVNPVDEKPPHY